MQTTPQHLREEYRARGGWSELRLFDLFAANAARVPARLAVVDPPNREALDERAPARLDYRALASLVDRTMVALAGAGLRRDDVLVTQLPNVAEYVATYLAAARLGIVLSPVPMQYRRAELEPIVDLDSYGDDRELNLSDGNQGEYVAAYGFLASCRSGCD